MPGIEPSTSSTFGNLSKYWLQNYLKSGNLLFSRRHPAQVVVVEAFAPEVGTRGVDDERAVEAWAGRAVNVVHEALAGLDGKGDSEEAVASSDAALKVKLSCLNPYTIINYLDSGASVISK